MHARWQHKEGDGDEGQRGNGAYLVVAPRRPECRKDGADKECGAVENGGWSTRCERRKIAPPSAVEDEPAPIGTDQRPWVPCIDAEIWVVPRRLADLADHVHHGEPEREGDKRDNRRSNKSSQHHTPRVTCTSSANQGEKSE